MVVKAGSPYQSALEPVCGSLETEDSWDLTAEEAGSGAPEDWDLDDPGVYPLMPGADTPERAFYERFVDYSDRGVRDVVLSGPVLAGWGPGRYFQSRRRAFQWCVEKYGEGKVTRVPYTKGRWAFLIRGLKTRPKGDSGAS